MNAASIFLGGDLSEVFNAIVRMFCENFHADKELARTSHTPIVSLNRGYSRADPSTHASKLGLQGSTWGSRSYRNALHTYISMYIPSRQLVMCVRSCVYAHMCVNSPICRYAQIYVDVHTCSKFTGRCGRTQCMCKNKDILSVDGKASLVNEFIDAVEILCKVKNSTIFPQ